MMASMWRPFLGLLVLLVPRLFASVDQINDTETSCHGRTVLTADRGRITDGSKKYRANDRCEWLIDAGSPNRTIHLTFDDMDTECSFDFLFVYDGNSYDSRLIATLSGDSLPRRVTAYSGQMLIYLFADRNYQKEGFDARYGILECPYNCSNRGQCVDHECHCWAGFSGRGCEVTNCPANCSSQGECKYQSGSQQMSCVCNPGYAGYSCELQVNGPDGQGRWVTVQEDHNHGMIPRTSHTSAFLKNCIWVFGGFDLNNVLGDLMRYCLDKNKWEEIKPDKELGPQTEDNNTLSSDTNNTVAPSWPSARRGHAMDSYGDGFFIFGGILEDESHSNELWYFNISTLTWSLSARDSVLKPMKVTGHTLTTVDDHLYLLGGKTEDRIFVDHMYRISAQEPKQWEKVLAKGGNYPPKRLVGHTAVFHKHSRSLIVFGGYTQGSALFSDRTQEIHSFHVDDRYWSHLTNSYWRDTTMPRPRAFHSTVLMGNYLVVYGGNTHDHTSEFEVCYITEMFFYHLGCHVWLNNTYFVGNSNQALTRGRFGHTAVAANGNIMFIVGGYSGQPMGDIQAYKVPAAIADFKCDAENPFCTGTNETSSQRDHCEEYPPEDQKVCQDDPECVFCLKGRTDSDHKCVHRTRLELCVDEEFHDPPDRCPGICPALHTCGACVIQGRGYTPPPPPETSIESGGNVSLPGAYRRVFIKKCSWCVKQAQCQTRASLSGTCKSPFETKSGVEGWWGGLSAALTTIHQCQTEDFPAGLHWIKYSHPLNETYPDGLVIVREAEGSLSWHSSRKPIDNQQIYSVKFWGFIHPLGASARHLNISWDLKGAKAYMYLSKDAIRTNKEMVLENRVHGSGTQIWTDSEYGRKYFEAKFPNVSRGHKYYMELETDPGNIKDKTISVAVKWNGYVKKGTGATVLTSEFLEPYSQGNCSSYNCRDCLTDTLCSWCELTRECLPRNSDDAQCVNTLGQHQYLITAPSECPSCDNHVQCVTCAVDPLCEWVISDGYCGRRMRKEEGVVRDQEQCYPPCHRRATCDECIQDKSVCAWCQNTQTCLPLSDYVTRYIYGQCTSWLDEGECTSCSMYTNCSSCLQEFGCGWCRSEVNHKLGICVQGDFSGAAGNKTCSALYSEAMNESTEVLASWHYEFCPEYDECQFGDHDCHQNATCVNTEGSHYCVCNPGFTGDGRTCSENCYHQCVHGRCSEFPDFVCECEIGWTGDSCDIDCGCNNHSTCDTGVGVCDQCLNRTAGPTCSECAQGAYGNALSQGGCNHCNCNGHGNISKGECNITGHCYCTGNTMGMHCEQCEPGYYGNPRHGGRCYLGCDKRQILTNISSGGMGSYPVSKERDLNHLYCLWIITTFPSIRHEPSDDESIPLISIMVEGDMELKCGTDTVYIYDGIPNFILGQTMDSSSLLGAFCGMSPRHDLTVQAHSGVATIYFEGNLTQSPTQGFNLTYQVHSCPGGCHGNRVCRNGNCVCKSGFWGHLCEVTKCPNNCSEEHKRGRCHNGTCICRPNFSGPDCSIHVGGNDLLVQVLSDSSLPVSDPENYNTWRNKDVLLPYPRTGHTLTACGNSLLFLFGGLSQDGQILDDMWFFDVYTRLWSRIFPATNHSPTGRYYHAAAYLPPLKMVFIMGGFEAVQEEEWPGVQVRATRTLWKFNIESHAWTQEVSPSWLVPPLVGHTFTYIGGTNLALIGGFSADGYFNNKIFIFDASGGLQLWEKGVYTRNNMTGAIPIGLYGHSAVFVASQHSVYVYGGYLYRWDSWSISRAIFVLNIPDKEWTMLHAEPFDSDKRTFHSAVDTGDSMAVVGGLGSDGRFAQDLLVYNYTGNTWIRLKLPDPQLERSTTAAQGVKAVFVEQQMYVFGGFIGQMVGTLTSIRLPADLCAAIHDMQVCNATDGCEVCEAPVLGRVCYSEQNKKSKPVGCKSLSSVRKRFSLFSIHNMFCQKQPTCIQCLAPPPSWRTTLSCQWCSNRESRDRCIPVNQSCSSRGLLATRNTTNISQCFETKCPASDCESCNQLGHCMWTRSSQHSQSLNWNCMPSPVNHSAFYSPPPRHVCPPSCQSLKTCEACLNSRGGEGGSHSCVWSEYLRECMTPAYIPLRCSLGQCGFLRTDSKHQCPQQPSWHRKCDDCTNSPGNGWCAFTNTNGEGICMAGGLTGPTDKTCSWSNASVDIVFNKHHDHNIARAWAYDKCRAENECKNGHHTCDVRTQDCDDTLEGYLCRCKEGYVFTPGTNVCEPVCHQGCDKNTGKCVALDKCECHFGWVGPKCDVQCNCNGHAQCPSVEQKNVCPDCKNNTMGAHCERCRPNFVGDPVNGGSCVSCFEFCYNHTDVCMDKDRYNEAEFSSLSVREGPRRSEAQCYNCGNNTWGLRCEKCVMGTFRLDKDPDTDPCRPCECNGHDNNCNPNTGEECSCHNNTESNCEREKIACWKTQCAQCKEYFTGAPTNGHQCYRTMTVDRDYCFDPDTQNNCNQFPKELALGRTVFFVVQPKYLNVDIRITIDVTSGSADVFLSNKKDTFQVFVNETSWVHEVFLDPMHVGTPGRETRSSGPEPRSRRSLGKMWFKSPIDKALEAGSILITESVPDFLKLQPEDDEYYKMSQFRNMEVQDKEETQTVKRFQGTHKRQQRRKSWHERLTRKSKYPSLDRQEREVPLEERRKRIEDYNDLANFLSHISPEGGHLAKIGKGRRALKGQADSPGLTVTDAKFVSTKMGEIEAGDLNTYITVGQQNSVLVVRDVRFRLVITLPRDQHELRTSRFYIIVRSRGGKLTNDTFGNLYFRQDQPHIDLFVFFSVFFSCFFLFLAVCVMLWKVKQTFDARRTRQQRAWEMECMASRPFAKILVLVEHEGPIYLPTSLGMNRHRSRIGRFQNRNQYYNNNDINNIHHTGGNIQPRELTVVPIAIEPTEDGFAAVGTVLFQLPGGISAPSRLCLGSSLTTRMPAPVAAQKSANVRRRTSASSC